MRLRAWSGVLLLLAAACLSACHPVVRHRHAWIGGNGWGDNADKPVKAAASLDCPQNQGDLKRVSAASDGKSCAYQGDEGSEVSLRLVSLEGKTPQEALAPEMTALHDLVPVKAGPAGGSVVVSASTQNDKDKVDTPNIDLPGIHISAHGDKADVRVLGTDIKADGDRADIRTDFGTKGTTIHAGPGGAEISAGSVGRHAAQIVYILAADNPGPSGYRTVGLLARGPVDGPLVVAEFHSKARHEDRRENDLQGLIDRNLNASDEDDD